MKSEKKKPSVMKIIVYAFGVFWLISVIFFVISVANAYISARPTNKFDEKTVSTCEREFDLEFDGGFAPVSFAHDGMRDSIYTLWIKNMGDPEDFMESHYDYDMYEFYYEDGSAPSVPDELDGYTYRISCVLTLKQKTNNRVDICFYKNEKDCYAARFERVYF